MEQKAFYEIEKPPKKSYAVIVREVLEGKNVPLTCMYTEPIFNKTGDEIGQLMEACNTMSNDVYECNCCGRDICNEHMSQKVVNNCYVCLDCAKLTSADIEKIQKLRLELNS